jgi:hypothetical protein
MASEALIVQSGHLARRRQEEHLWSFCQAIHYLNARLRVMDVRLPIQLRMTRQECHFQACHTFNTVEGKFSEFVIEIWRIWLLETFLRASLILQIRCSPTALSLDWSSTYHARYR